MEHVTLFPESHFSLFIEIDLSPALPVWVCFISFSEKSRLQDRLTKWLIVVFKWCALFLLGEGLISLCLARLWVPPNSQFGLLCEKETYFYTYETLCFSFENKYFLLWYSRWEISVEGWNWTHQHGDQKSPTLRWAGWLLLLRLLTLLLTHWCSMRHYKPI